MDGLAIPRAYLAGWSMGGNEITAMASKYPDRVDRIVYLEAAYDWGDPAFAIAFNAAPPIILNPPASAMASLDAWRNYQKTVVLPAVTDTTRYEAYVRELITVQRDGSVRPRMSDSVSQLLATVLLTSRRDYRKVLAPALAIYAETMLDVHNGDSALCAANLAWEQKYMAPFRKASVERVRKELPKVEIVSVPGTHMDFIFRSRQQVVDAMRQFLSGQNL
jgi:pimeloyl-ACP methyl ester carboxylesterase